MSNAPSDWISTVAQQVCTLVRDGRVVARFRAQCAAFLDERRRDEGQLAAWKLRRKEHCERGLHTLAEFKARTEDMEKLGNDRDAIERTRPAEDSNKIWVFDYYQDHLAPDELARLGSPTNGSMLVAFCVWVPPDLCLSASPKLTIPPLFGRFTGHLHSPEFGRSVEPGIASLAEKYATLAAIHDARFPDRDPIHELKHVDGGLLTAGFRRRAPREALREVVGALPNAAEANVLTWLADVEADVAEHIGPPGQPNRTGGEQAGDGKAAEDQRRTRAQQQLTAAIEDLLARFDNDGPYGADFFGPGPAAAELAAVLGFAAPPVEVIVIRRPDSHPFLDKNGHVPAVGIVRFNDPEGLTHTFLTLSAFAEAADGVTPEITELPADMQAVARARSILESWSRKVRSLNAQCVTHSPAHIPTREDSLAIMAFKWRLGRELAGRGDLSPDEEMFWLRKHQTAMKQGLRGALNELGRIAGNRFQLVAKVNPTAGRKQTTSPLPEKEHAGDPTNVFRLVGAMWEIRFADERGNFPDRKGFQIIARLLRFPNEASQAVALQGIDPRAEIGDESVQETLDDEAVAKIKERLAEMERDIDQADENHDDATSSRLRLEKERLVAESTKALGLGGRSRRLGTPPPAERARIAVRQNLDRVYQVLRAAQPPMIRLADHLERFILTEGQAYAYRPETTPPWDF